MRELNKKELRQINGGCWLCDFGKWAGKKAAQFVNYISENPTQYNTTANPY